MRVELAAAVVIGLEEDPELAAEAHARLTAHGAETAVVEDSDARRGIVEAVLCGAGGLTPGRLTYFTNCPSGFSGFGSHANVCASQMTPTSGST